MTCFITQNQGYKSHKEYTSLDIRVMLSYRWGIGWVVFWLYG